MGVVRFYACAGEAERVVLRLLQKAALESASTWVMGQAAALKTLSDALWRQDGFFAHAGPDASESVRRRSALVLSVERPSQSVGLLILLDVLSPDAEGLVAERLFDVFGSAAPQRMAARERFRWHQRQGAQPESVQV